MSVRHKAGVCCCGTGCCPVRADRLSGEGHGRAVRDDTVAMTGRQLLRIEQGMGRGFRSQDD